MSLEASDGSPESDFRPHTFSHTKVGDRVMWPLVDMLWRDDWRGNSYVGNIMRMACRGDFNGRSMEVAVTAYTEMEPIDEDTLDERLVVSTAAIDVQELVVDERRDMLLTRVAMQDEKVWQHDEEDLITKVSSTYTFYDVGGLEIVRNQLIEKVDGQNTWYIETSNLETPETDMDNPETVIIKVMSSQLFEHDMELLEAGLYVFRAPEDILKALSKIKSKPITRQN